MLTNQLGVTPAQAAGGSGAIFQAAKARMAPSAFQTLTAKVPEVTQLLNQAPAASSGSALSRGISALGGGNSSAATLLQLGQTFKSLNMSPDMVNQFVPVVVNYVKSQGGQALSNMLQTALIGG
ncbi:MAG: hypothetical protein AXA67_10700 [Methylothermaceae bacteria B42]|nr:MAG: hypothetical protein AXA67_10700 [Methylothermaceae bacteria B42]